MNHNRRIFRRSESTQNRWESPRSNHLTVAFKGRGSAALLQEMDFPGAASEKNDTGPPQSGVSLMPSTHAVCRSIFHFGRSASLASSPDFNSTIS